MHYIGHYKAALVSVTKDDEIAQLHNVLEEQQGEIQHLNKLLDRLTKAPVSEPYAAEVAPRAERTVPKVLAWSTC